MGRVKYFSENWISSITMLYVPGQANIPADVFSRLVIKPNPVPVFHILTLQCTHHQRSLIEKYHAYLCAHSGFDRTINLMTQYVP